MRPALASRARQPSMATSRLAGGVMPEPAPAADQRHEQQERADRNVAAAGVRRGTIVLSRMRAIDAQSPAECGVSAPLTPRLARAWVAPELAGLLREQVARPCQCYGVRAWSRCNPDEHKNRSKQRGSVGFRLRLADVAAGLRLPRAPPGAPGRRPPGALRLFLRASRHAVEARAGARPRPRRQLPRHRLPGGRRQAQRRRSIICARANR